MAQARQVYESGDEINRDNLFLAEELVQRVLASDPAEPSAWEFGAWLSYMMVWHQIDESGARREKMLQQVNRAAALAPDTVSARHREVPTDPDPPGRRAGSGAGGGLWD
ncbi:MAG: hypothetical protein EXS32_00995 [Opitutus sp.]|nr:hypothetical protein [Opitutus sp.]